ncbi:hypothetical protein TVAG_455300 [Trichomonas vaginalis G3]|uniref:Uncharacterized protein n=1 Tax=Trichomonas vaginalis (strain ATCC PRA-98 / G3) TaxID=412133 RepID=A2GAU7_TRIV3|nr:hypothetical protein TVAGG3_0807180 [Trichomonas vaginalis G3]EAX85721.1 hypothetical protein TVAG_455300 [Trichomonas vaginalis G3]KAI5496941.1 hypothetical protein TVAGG3_0807180 [Trichomonas vaginalis G3]|eukprot:XP_001298651.1 hypothetical protein [Trichomonas vaginalis G3]
MSTNVNDHDTEPYEGCVRSQYNVMEDSDEDSDTSEDIVSKSEAKSKEVKDDDKVASKSSCCLLI